MLSNTPRKLSSHQDSSSMSSILSNDGGNGNGRSPRSGQSSSQGIAHSSYTDSNAGVAAMKSSRQNTGGSGIYSPYSTNMATTGGVSTDRLSHTQDKSHRASSPYGNDNTAPLNPSPGKYIYRNQSNVFNYNEPLAAHDGRRDSTDSSRSTPRKDPMASDIFFGGNTSAINASAAQTPRYGNYVPSPQTASRRTTPGNQSSQPHSQSTLHRQTPPPLPSSAFNALYASNTNDNGSDDYRQPSYDRDQESDAALVDRFESFSTKDTANQAHHYRTSPHSSDMQNSNVANTHSPTFSRGQSHAHHHQRSSIFNDVAPAAPVRGSRRHFHDDKSSSDIFHKVGDSNAAPPPSPPVGRRSKQDSQQHLAYEPSWSPKGEYNKSTSFSNIFGGASGKTDPEMTRNAVAVAADYDAASSADLPASRNSKINYSDRVGGLSSSDLNRDTRGKGRRLVQTQSIGSQIWH
ncbi:hypothetical protein BASA50_000415 [Batrachochytrium salamandrivorans]|uniref:Uncharacterized protein n=1 Tax=Batrachochytrium salamandrivorans TaxID=1357716 RepID=A0ABQ8EWL9_9FUNG|nr:hypothetical protein BASA60_008579 [Batrachochytrium salamandrivorans]KAH6576076.1 hypothetical protein BASA62_001622 [Batrachochytrium salamandrivorans]KAH6581986.1 hypothetical protein BASA61_008733 [Batrachochytrium salamandrivorans]KAH6586460.1 hypothetical protein BASA50_000415 [Batrachochytrium salamandrivorans]KAH9275473.1 hypothetical protein BASA83_002247 [Batrachochytrium salamandrivorans]